MRVMFLLLPLAFAAAETKLPPTANSKLEFEKHVPPLLAEKCYSCPGREVQLGGLQLSGRQRALRGGGMQTPPTGPLSSEEIGILRAWIDQCAEFRIQVEDERPARPVDPKLATLIDAAAVRRILDANPELVKATDLAGSTPLHQAAGFGTLQTVALLLAYATAGFRITCA